MSENQYEQYAKNYIAQKEVKELYGENQVSAEILLSHGTFREEYEPKFVGMHEGKKVFVLKEKKMDINNDDLTSGFQSTEMQVWNFCNASYLSIIEDLEKELQIDLTGHYNKFAKMANFSYALSKGGGKAAEISKKHFIETQSYELYKQQDMTSKKGGNIGSGISKFFSALPTTKQPIKP